MQKMESENKHNEPPPKGNILKSLWTSVAGLVILIWNLAVEGLKMLLSTLQQIPPIVIGLISATLLCWFGLTILTTDQTIRIIFAIAISLLALGGLGLAYVQKWLDFKKYLHEEEGKRMKEKEAAHLKRTSAQEVEKDPMQQQLHTLQKLLEVRQKMTIDTLENQATIEKEITDTFITVLKKIKK